MAKREFYVVITSDEDGYFIGEVTQIKGCFNQGDTVDDLMGNMLETVRVCLEEYGTKDTSEFIEVQTILGSSDSTETFHREFYVVVTRDESGIFWGVAPQLRECYGNGKTKTDLMNRMRKAIALGLKCDDLEDCSKFIEVRKLEV